MKVVGLITEYNPFHNGHLYHIQEAKSITGAEVAIVVMSGNFVQRGTPALIDKYSRTQMALSCGADIVLELPVCYATGSAEFFALGAVSILDKLGIVDFLCFGSECGDITSITSIAKILIDEPIEYKEILTSLIKKGKTYPAARMEAVQLYASYIEHSLLSSPNNILGIEYMKALLKLKSSIQPVTMKRKEAGYHEEELTETKSFAISSATAIRKSIRESQLLTDIKPHVPETVYSILQSEFGRKFPICEEDYTVLLTYKLMQESAESLTGYSDVNADLANRINRIDTSGLSFLELARTIKTKQWTLTRVNRVLIHILLNLYKENFEQFNQSGYAQYARILGLKRASSHFIRQIVKNERIPVITKLADADTVLSDCGKMMLKEDIFASHLYNHIVFNKFGYLSKDEFTHGIILQE